MIRKLGIKPVVAADTAGSAREVAEANDKTRAAIASRLAAEIYGLDILAQDIEDEAHNTTRFIVLSRDARWAKSGDGPVITTFLFRVRNVPAALYKALGGFATNGVNMTKLESYMIEGNFFATQFYADVEGHPEHRNLVFAFEELAFYSKEMKILGVYPAHPFRSDVRGIDRLTLRLRTVARRPIDGGQPAKSQAAAEQWTSLLWFTARRSPCRLALHAHGLRRGAALRGMQRRRNFARRPRIRSRSGAAPCL